MEFYSLVQKSHFKGVQGYLYFRGSNRVFSGNLRSVLLIYGGFMGYKVNLRRCPISALKLRNSPYF